jgi:hypothetical protein
MPVCSWLPNWVPSKVAKIDMLDAVRSSILVAGSAKRHAVVSPLISSLKTVRVPLRFAKCASNTRPPSRYSLTYARCGIVPLLKSSRAANAPL